VSAAQNWWETLPAIAGFRCIAHDLSGFGHTIPPAGEELGMAGWIKQVVRVLDALGIERAILVGNSLGGRIALHVGIEYPARVRGIVTMGAVGLNPPPPGDTPSARLATRPFTKADVEVALQSMVHNRDVLTPSLVESRYRMAVADGARERFTRVIEARNRTMFTYALEREALAGLAMPVLVTDGREDHIIPLAMTVELATIIPFADLHIFANAGHWAQAERRDDFNAQLTQFFARHSPD